MKNWVKVKDMWSICLSEAKQFSQIIYSLFIHYESRHINNNCSLDSEQFYCFINLDMSLVITLY